MSEIIPTGYAGLLGEVHERIRAARYRALQAGESWGKSVVETLARDLPAEFPGVQGFSSRNIWYMRDLYLACRTNEILQQLVAEIAWTHNLAILTKCKADPEREFYLRMTKAHGWAKNVLIHHIENRSYEKTLRSQSNFAQVLPTDVSEQSTLAIKDEYTFDFLGLAEEYSERQLESAVLAHVEPFLRAMGGVFSFVGSYRMTPTLPRELEGELPDPEQVARLLTGVGE